MSVEALVKEYQKLSEAERSPVSELIHPWHERQSDDLPKNGKLNWLPAISSL